MVSPPPAGPTSAPAPASKRLTSIDVFRGATIAGMILVNSQSPEYAYRPFVHAQWHGVTFADTIFPAFLFIVGVSLTLSTAGRMARGEAPGSLIAHAVRRSALLFSSGVFIEMLRFPERQFPFFTFGDLQLTGVLQKIALCYLVALLVYVRAALRGVIIAIVGLNLIYLVFLFFYPVPGCGPGVLTTACNFPGYVDGIVLDGFRWGDPTRQDPDGLGAILPAITSVLFGVVFAQVLRTEPRPLRQVGRLLAGGIGMMGIGALLGMWVPFNKPLWTTSYAAFMAGLAAVGMATSIWVVDVKRGVRWCKPLEILGLNSIAAYLISRPTTNVLKVHVWGVSLYTVLGHFASPPTASLLFATAALIAVYCLMWFMHRRGWHLRF